jgi:hypothetical protein
MDRRREGNRGETTEVNIKYCRPDLRSPPCRNSQIIVNTAHMRTPDQKTNQSYTSGELCFVGVEIGAQYVYIFEGLADKYTREIIVFS